MCNRAAIALDCGARASSKMSAAKRARAIAEGTAVNAVGAAGSPDLASRPSGREAFGLRESDEGSLYGRLLACQAWLCRRCAAYPYLKASDRAGHCPAVAAESRATSRATERARALGSRALPDD